MNTASSQTSTVLLTLPPLSDDLLNHCLDVEHEDALSLDLDTGQATSRRALTPEEAAKNRLRVRVKDGRFFWESRDGGPLEVSTAGAYTYLMSQPGRYIRLTNYCSGLCMSEIAALAAIEGLDCLLNDAMYGILFRDINPRRTLIDQHFSRLICSVSGIWIMTGEDNYMKTTDAVESGNQVLASQFINEAYALNAGVKKSQMSIGHAMEMDPFYEKVILMEVARAQMTRQIFPEAPLK